jgi:D-alanyl-D-alanine carboxypeptidase
MTTQQQNHPLHAKLETPQEPLLLPEHRYKTGNYNFFGMFALALIFVASSAFTFAFFADQTRAERVQEQAVAVQESVNDPFTSVSIIARSAYVQDLATGRVLYALDVDVARPLASLTKVMTALTAAQVLPLESTITIPFDTAPPGSAERLGKGQVWRVDRVIDFTLIASSNGGAAILAQVADESIRARYPQAPHTSSMSATIWRMNDFARELGLLSMSFANPSGLDENTTTAGAYGSARDVGALFAYAASTSPDIFAGTTQSDMVLYSENGVKTSAFNTDTALDTIPGIVMGKTGYTDLAGGNLAIVFEIGPAHPVVAVVLGSTLQGRFEDMKKLVAASTEAVGR